MRMLAIEGDALGFAAVTAGGLLYKLSISDGCRVISRSLVGSLDSC